MQKIDKMNHKGKTDFNQKQIKQIAQYRIKKKMNIHNILKI